MRFFRASKFASRISRSKKSQAIASATSVESFEVVRAPSPEPFEIITPPSPEAFQVVRTLCPRDEPLVIVSRKMRSVPPTPELSPSTPTLLSPSSDFLPDTPEQEEGEQECDEDDEDDVEEYIPRRRRHRWSQIVFSDPHAYPGLISLEEANTRREVVIRPAEILLRERDYAAEIKAKFRRWREEDEAAAAAAAANGSRG